MANFKPTLKEPTVQGRKFETNFKKTVIQQHAPHSVMNETDGMLSEVEQSLKKKIFSLDKMEALVFSDPKLAAVYEEMAENGEEKYGYHHNETIMNMLFNDYVLNSPKYLQKYKQSIPVEKKRRDKSGINQLKKAGEKKMTQSGLPKLKPAEVSEDIEAPTAVAFLIHPDDPEVYAFFPDENYDSQGKYKTGYAHVGQHTAIDPKYAAESREASPEEYQELKNELEGLGYNLEVLNGLRESTSAGSAGGAAGYVGYAGPAAWSSKGDLMGKGKKKGNVMNKPIWKGGSIIQESNYLTETDGFEKYINELNEQSDSNFISAHSQAYGTVNNMNKEDQGIIKKDITTHKWDSSNIKDGIALDENDSNFEQVKAEAQRISKEEGVVQHVNQVSDNNFKLSDWYDADSTVISFENGRQLNETNLQEKAKSKSQQRFMGMVHAVQKGELSPNKVGGEVERAADSMSDKDAEDFASTKHKGLPEKIKENTMINKWEGSDRNLEISLDEYGVVATQKDNKDYPDEWFVIYKMGDDAFGTGHIREEEINKIGTQNSWSDDGGKASREFLSYVGQDAESWLNNPFVSKLQDEISYWGYENIMGSDYSPITKEEAFALINGNDSEEVQEDTQTMIQNNGTSMSNKAQATGDQSSGVPVGMQATGGLNEADMKLLEEINNELEAFSIHHNKLKLMAEDRKPSALVLRDRVGSENEKNFKSDFQNSDTKKVIDVEKELMWKDQQTDVAKNPQKLGQEIEKTEIKSTDAEGDEALKNVGDSTNDKGDEIPKRNLTSKEQEEVNLYRNGLHSNVFDNEPSKRFEDRMKADMGDDIYEMRQKQLAFKGKAPMYNKDPQPVEDTTADKVQFDKEQTGWNERMGLGNEKSLKESMITGRYHDILNKRRLLEFRLGEVSLVETVDDLFELDFTGLGNTYNSKTVDKKVVVNETVVNAIAAHKFYTDGEKVFATKNPTQSLNENEKKEKPVINEQQEKMKHLLGYKPNDFVNTASTKKNRGF